MSRLVASALMLFSLLHIGCAPSVAACGPERCGGCCDANNACQPGTARDACGAGGNTCNTCVAAVGQVCAATVCVFLPPDAGPRLGPEVGRGDHTPSSVDLTEIVGTAAGISRPTDLDFNPRRPDELWVVNSGDDSVVIVSAASLPTRTSERRKDGYAVHFMANPSSIAFGGSSASVGTSGTFATCQDSRNTYGGAAAPNDFMGVSLWSSDLTIFARQNPNGLGSHLDMLHASPLCKGLAHQGANVYWAFGGLANAIIKYDFGQDDGIGNDDHTDGEAYEYLTGRLKSVTGIPSHLLFQADEQQLLIADTGNSRLLRLKVTSGTRGLALRPPEPMAAYWRMNGAEVDEVVTPQSQLLEAPSGVEGRNGLVYVSDNANSRISVFNPAGERVNYLDTGLVAGSLGGMAFGPDGRLYLVDLVANRVLRIDPR